MRVTLLHGLGQSEQGAFRFRDRIVIAGGLECGRYRTQQIAPRMRTTFSSGITGRFICYVEISTHGAVEYIGCFR
jgi:hypothetical protein